MTSGRHQKTAENMEDRGDNTSMCVSASVLPTSSSCSEILKTAVAVNRSCLPHDNADSRTSPRPSIGQPNHHTELRCEPTPAFRLLRFAECTAPVPLAPHKQKPAAA